MIRKKTGRDGNLEEERGERKIVEGERKENRRTETERME